MNDIVDELLANWIKWEELVDGNCEFGGKVAAILADPEARGDELGRIRDVQYDMAKDCAKYAIECDQWFGDWGALKNAAGFPDYYSFKEVA